MLSWSVQRPDSPKRLTLEAMMLSSSMCIVTLGNFDKWQEGEALLRRVPDLDCCLFRYFFFAQILALRGSHSPKSLKPVHMIG